jgi:hypothetical protein
MLDDFYYLKQRLRQIQRLKRTQRLLIGADFAVSSDIAPSEEIFKADLRRLIRAKILEV